MASSVSSSSWILASSFPIKQPSNYSPSKIGNIPRWVRRSPLQGAPPIKQKQWNRGEQGTSGGLRNLAAIKESDHSKISSRTSSFSSKEERVARKERERLAYLVAAMLSSVGITSMAAMAVFSRFSWQLQGGEFPVVEMFGTLALSVGAAVGMEYWARWAHRALWHDSLWHVHESHHRGREGAFEANDVFAVTNAVPAIGLLSFGFFNKGLLPGLCFGAGLGITVFGMAYMFVHDGLVHRRFPVGPIATVPRLQRVAAAHQLHHSDKFGGVPYGLFLGPEELAEVGGTAELEKEVQRRIDRSI